MKKFNLISIIYVFLIIISFFLFSLNVKADSSAFWTDRILYTDSTTSSGTTFQLWGGHNYRQNLTQNNIIWFNSNNSPYGFDAKIVVQDSWLYDGAIVKAEVYILTNYPLVSKKYNYYTTHDIENDYVQIIKIADEVEFKNNSGIGAVYKLIYSFKNQDCIDGESQNGDYICYGDNYTRTFGFGSITDSNTYALQLYGYGKVTYSEVEYSQPVSNIDDLANLSVFDTIKALPIKLLSWFTSLPSNISSSLSSFFTSLGDKISNLPSQLSGFFTFLGDRISGFFTSLGEKITNLPSQLSGFFTSLGDRIEGFFDFLITGISNILKNLFIPSDIVFDELKITFQNKLGFIYELPSQVIDFGLNLSSLDFAEMNIINFPSISILGTSFWQNQNISIVEAKSTFQPFRYLTDVLCVAVCVNALRRYREHLFGGGSYN